MHSRKHTAVQHGCWSPRSLGKDWQILVVGGDMVSGHEPSTGKEIWRQRVGGNYSASLTLAGDKLFVQSESGECVVYRVGDQLEEIARNNLPGRIFASYAVHEDDWIIRSETGVYRIGK